MRQQHDEIVAAYDALHANPQPCVVCGEPVYTRIHSFRYVYRNQKAEICHNGTRAGQDCYERLLATSTVVEDESIEGVASVGD